jgi:deoxycytidine triphosphate deaminase
MLLSCDQIRQRNIVSDGVEDSFRFNSYDLTVGAIIQASGDEVEDHLLKPQGIIEVISRERICLPEDIVGYALVKTKLCNLGILPLNIGIIDSGYQGYLSAMLLNFSNEDFRIDKGDVFLRLTFQECHVASNFQTSEGQPYDKYKCDKKKK